MATDNNGAATTSSAVAITVTAVGTQETPQAKAALNVFIGEVGKLSPVAYQIQGYKLNRAIFLNTVTRLSQSIVGEMSTDDAVARLSKDIDEAVKMGDRVAVFATGGRLAHRLKDAIEWEYRQSVKHLRGWDPV